MDQKDLYVDGPSVREIAHLLDLHQRTAAASGLYQIDERTRRKRLDHLRLSADWETIFADSASITAVLDGLLRHSATIKIEGESCRPNDKKKACMIARKIAEEAPDNLRDPPLVYMRIKGTPFVAQALPFSNINQLRIVNDLVVIGRSVGDDASAPALVYRRRVLLAARRSSMQGTRPSVLSARPRPLIREKERRSVTWVNNAQMLQRQYGLLQQRKVAFVI